MNIRVIINRLLFYWLSSYALASVSYLVLWLVMPGHYVFGALYRMFLYHWEFPLQYIAIPCFFYGIIATLLGNAFRGRDKRGRILITAVIIALTILISSPFGGMLWHFHDMKAGYFPVNWTSKMINKGCLWGLQMGWLVIALSVPYNIIGSVICYRLTRKGIELFKT